MADDDVLGGQATRDRHGPFSVLRLIGRIGNADGP
jgi:hypothetical protein